MSRLIKKYLPVMDNFKKLKSKDRRRLIVEDEKLTKCVCEICLNLIKGNIPLNKPQKVKLRPHKKIIRKLARKVKNLKNRKKLLQKGAGVFLPLLFSVISPILSKLISE